MGKVAISSGGAGDVVFSIPIMRMLGITRLYLKQSHYVQGYGSMFTGLKELIGNQGFEVLPTRDDGLGFDQFDPAIEYDVNMDAWRECRMRGKWHIMFSMMTYWRVMRKDWKLPWLKIDDKPTDISGEDYTLWFLSPRWRESDCNWKKVFASVGSNKYFIGFLEDWEAFCQEVGFIEYAYTPDLMIMARLIRDCRALYCNQGVAVAIAQGLGKEYHCAFKRNKTNVRLYTINEYSL